MTLYSKNGSIPYPFTDGTNGWIEVPEKPAAPEGKEVVWWYPPGWVIRDPKPAVANVSYDVRDETGNVVSSEVKPSDWSWNQSTETWTPYPLPSAEIVIEATDVIFSVSDNSIASGSDTVIV